MPDSEFRIYTYIEQVLASLGWDTRNPSRGGSVYTQSEFRQHDSTLSVALGRQVPENIVVIPWDGSLRYWVVEAKRSHNELQLALSEAQGYAEDINQVAPGQARFATGIAGSPDASFYVTTTYWDGAAWQEVSINNYETTGFLSLDQCHGILSQNNPKILHYDVDLDAFLTKANAINQTLYRNGIAARDRAQLVAGLLLAIAQDSYMAINPDPQVLVRDVNSRIMSLLMQHGKAEFSPEVELKLPNTTENHRKYWSAIVLTMQHLREMNIRSAINSGTDALGQFYETFLKFANDASEMGIVLTPRHITKFAVDVMNINHTDVIFDPTCGTGGFLVAALDSIRARHYGTHMDVYDAFRNDCLYGVEQADAVFGLALVNMIFRGDGKSRIHNGNCFDNRFYRAGGQIVRLNKDGQPPEGSSGRPFTRVLMNPPFAIEEKEREFVDYALDQVQVGGLLFAILPNGPITGATEKGWRAGLLRRHTVRAVVKMRDDLFMPNVHKGTYALVIEAWRAHLPDDLVYFAILQDDSHASQKSKLLRPDQGQDNVERITTELAAFLGTNFAGIAAVPRESAVVPLRLDDELDFASEAHLESGPPDYTNTDVLEGLFIALAQQRAFRRPPEARTLGPSERKEFEIGQLFNIVRGNCPPLKNFKDGDTPVVTSSEQSNGVAGYYAVDPELQHGHCMTISTNGSEAAGKAFWHPYPFAAVADVLVCEPLTEYEGLDPSFYLYVCNAVTHNAWRFDYFRKCTISRLRRDVRVSLPMQGEVVDFAKVKEEMSLVPGYDRLLEALQWADQEIKDHPHVGSPELKER